nr:hypothetical protein [Bernardetiaceae bacterium]
FIVNDYIAVLDGIERGEPIDDEDAHAFARVRLLARERAYEAKPSFLIKGNLVRKIPYVNTDIGVKLSLEAIRPPTTDRPEPEFDLSWQTTQKDWVILKAVEMPLINLLWIGTLLMALGMGIAVVRRYRESRAVVPPPPAGPAPKLGKQPREKVVG